MANRISEQDNLYQNPDEVEAFSRSARRGLVGTIERFFVQYILKRYRDCGELSVLDVGTGPGWIPMKLAIAKPNWKITALDQSKLMLERAQRQALKRGAHVNWILADAVSTGLDENSFDLVISHFAMHEFNDPLAILNEMIRLVKENQNVLVQDLVRPLPWVMPFLRLGMLAGHPLSPRMRRQGRESLQAAYTVEELRFLAVPLNYHYRVRWNPLLFTLLLDIEKTKLQSPIPERLPAVEAPVAGTV